MEFETGEGKKEAIDKQRRDETKAKGRCSAEER